ncbi:protein translocase subunit SecF [Candidatus Parcubacteria bacterium]|nr:protein translocase subunit SecF [Candidatus Parcubacteria bacterium]
MYNIIQKRKIWLSLSSVIVGFAIIAIIIWGLNFGIDFTGGSLLEVKFLQARPTVSEVQEQLADLELGSLIVQPVGEDSMILRFQDTSEEKHQEVLSRLKALTPSPRSEAGNPSPTPVVPATSLGTGTGEGSQESEVGGAAGVEELRFDSVGPSIGQELKRKSIAAIIIVLVAIVLYIAWAFRKVSKPIASWKYGLTAVITLFHDVMIVVGVFAVLGRFAGMEINTAFVAAILTVLGYSVNDTIVVFDRIRENLPRSDEDFEGTVNISVNQTLRRSINTSITTLLVLLAVFFFGGSSIRDFVLALSIGVFIGTYSSIFLASPLLVVWERFKK